MKEKKGLSPVVATILLISLALILALIIYFYARGFIGEVPEKFGRDISLACADVDFDADVAFDGVTGDVSIDLINRGNIPLYGIEVRSKSDGTISITKPFQTTISTGATAHITATPDELTASSGDDLILVPILLGTKNDQKQQYTCDDSFGVIKTVQ